MDQGLFRKHILQIQKVHDIKDDVCAYIQEKTGVTINKEEIMVTQKIVTIQTSSVKRSVLLQKNIKALLQEKGYTTGIK